MHTSLTDNVDEPLIWETWLSRTWFPTLMVADDLAIFASLARSPSSAEQLAAALHLNANAARSVLALLAALGFLHSRNGTYHLTAVAHTHLLPESQRYWGGVFSQTRRFDPVAARIRKVLVHRPGDTIASGTAGSWGDAWCSGNLSARQAADIADFMHSHSVGAAERLAAAVTFSEAESLLDVGGGSGCYSIAIARRHPGVKCTVVDLPHACNAARHFIEKAGLSERIDTRSMDMFENEWPQGYDAILLSNILHDWPPSQRAELLRHARRALRAKGRLYVHEALLDDDRNGPKTAAAFSVLVMLGTPGGQLTRDELQQLLHGAGFLDVHCRDIPPLYSLVQARISCPP